MGTKYLVISDIHHRWKIAEKIISAITHDKVIFLGDYFDDFGDNPYIASNTAKWLKSSLQDLNRIHLLGNHDMPLIAPNQFTYCSGWTLEKHKAVNEILNHDDWRKLIPFFYIQDGSFLLSHAGIHESIFSHPINGISIDYIKDMCEKGMLDIKAGLEHAAFSIGKSCGGWRPYGGLNWLRWHELDPIKGIHQIVGHTELVTPSCKYLHKGKLRFANIGASESWSVNWEALNKSSSINWNIDCNNAYFAIIEDGKIQVKLTLDYL